MGLWPIVFICTGFKWNRICLYVVVWVVLQLQTVCEIFIFMWLQFYLWSSEAGFNMVDRLNKLCSLLSVLLNYITSLFFMLGGAGDALAAKQRQIKTVEDHSGDPYCFLAPSLGDMLISWPLTVFQELTKPRCRRVEWTLCALQNHFTQSLRERGTWKSTTLPPSTSLGL